MRYHGTAELPTNYRFWRAQLPRQARCPLSAPPHSAIVSLLAHLLFHAARHQPPPARHAVPWRTRKKACAAGARTLHKNVPTRAMVTSPAYFAAKSSREGRLRAHPTSRRAATRRLLDRRDGRRTQTPSLRR